MPLGSRGEPRVTFHQTGINVQKIITIRSGALLLLLLLQGCAPLLVGGAATGVGMANDRRTVGAMMEDQSIEIKSLVWLRDQREVASRLDVSATSYNLQLLLTGQAADEEARQQYVDWARHLQHVRKVYNEVQIGPFDTFSDKARDSAITGRVNLSLLKVRLPGFNPNRVKVVTQRGVVYLMGLLTPEEEAAVEEVVRYVEGVRQVVKIIERY